MSFMARVTMKRCSFGKIEKARPTRVDGRTEMAKTLVPTASKTKKPATTSLRSTEGPCAFACLPSSPHCAWVSWPL